mmetsp:Transcript_41391/g.98122  ORF Transcript_41391/g.98122 Transcript_41391/m.98122 type:complete len:267 (-) Transcript_41391:5-805(-)
MSTQSFEGGQYREYLEVAKQAAFGAGEFISRAFSSTDKGVKDKGKATDLVTETDQACENYIRETIKKVFPEHKFIGEEEVAASGGIQPTLTNEPTWMCDPLDGTTNFVHGFPFVCTCIALVIDKQIVAGVVHNPVLRETFTAARGCGAFMNGNPISVTEEKELGRALCATEVGVHRDFETMMAISERLMKVTNATRSIRCSGSCAMNMCGVALGRLDAFFEIGFGGCWDVAAAALIVQEAGGQVLDPSGGEFDVMAPRGFGPHKDL